MHWNLSKKVWHCNFDEIFKESSTTNKKVNEESDIRRLWRDGRNYDKNNYFHISGGILPLQLESKCPGSLIIWGEMVKMCLYHILVQSAVGNHIHPNYSQLTYSVDSLNLKYLRNWWSDSHGFSPSLKYESSQFLDSKTNSENPVKLWCI